MVLPESRTAALLLLLLSTLCFVLWPNLFKMAGAKWRFELFSMDFAVGSFLAALIAAYTLGTLGSDLDFGDSMLVAGRRAELMAVGAGAVFAFGNMLYLGTIALIGLSNATLLTFSIFGCGVSIWELLHGGNYLTSAAAVLVLALAAAFTFFSAKAARAGGATTKPTAGVRGRQPNDPKAIAPSTKAAMTGILAGIAFAGVWPVLKLAQTEDLGIGAYGGTLMAAIGIISATFFLNFFFMNISLEGGQVGYPNFLSGGIASHLTGLLSGIFWTSGALALYTAKTGTVPLSAFETWTAPFAGALLSVLTGILFWQTIKLSPSAKIAKSLGAILFVTGVAALLYGIRT